MTAKQAALSMGLWPKQAWIIRVIFMALIVTLVVVGLLEVRKPTTFPMTVIQIHGDLMGTQQAEIQERLAFVLDSGFFSVDIRECQSRLMQLPWVESVTIKRQWPNTLFVHIKEYQPLAYWGEQAVLNTFGDIIEDEMVQSIELTDDFPHFYGPEGSEKTLLNQYISFLTELAPLGLGIKTLRLTPEMSWQLELDGGLLIHLGRQDLEERLGRFVMSYKSILTNKISRIAYVDLRYTNGVAIGWKTGVKEKNL